MAYAKFRKTVKRLLSVADIKIGGNRPWDIQVHNDDFYPTLLVKGSIGLGESYMDGWWECNSLDEFFYRIFRSGVNTRVKPMSELLNLLKAKMLNLQRRPRAFQIGKHHYDIGNDLYRLMLDKRMIYSCGYWKDASTLDQAQEAKLDLVCRKLKLKPGMRVLDIGCGWGGAAKFISERYGVEVVGITVSREQAGFAKELCRGLPVEIRLSDYRSLKGSFDNIFSLGMFEHVGSKNYVDFFRVVNRCLKDDGLFLLQTIGNNRTAKYVDPWIDRYIFPNSFIPSSSQICTAIEDFFVIENWHIFGPDYDKTLMQWYRNFHGNWDFLKKEYDNRFYRMWEYYLLSCAGAFRARGKQLWQIVLSKEGLPSGYCVSGVMKPFVS